MFFWTFYVISNVWVFDLEMLAPIAFFIISYIIIIMLAPPEALNNGDSLPHRELSPQVPSPQSLSVTPHTIEEESQRVRSDLEVEEDCVRNRVDPPPPPYHNSQLYQDVTEDLPPTYNIALIMP